MSIANSERAGAGVVWSRVEDGFHVGSRNGEFLGYIDRDADGRYAAFDLYSRPLGFFPTLVSAMAVIADVELVSMPQPRWSSRHVGKA